MTVCSLSSPYRIRVRRRLAAAGAVSLLLHLMLASSFTGPVTGRRALTPARFLSARLIRETPPDSPLAVPQVSEDEVPAQQLSEKPVKPRQLAREVSIESAAAQGVAAESAAAAGIQVTDTPDLTYYAARQLDVYPVLTTALDLAYPEQASGAGVTGRALILLHIDHIGTVSDVAVVEADPPGYFEEDVRRAFMAARFRPALKGGRPVRSRVLVHIDYGAEQTTPAPTPR
ncbi:MAG: energy transducer TonB [Burkholderiales bacterium]